jgi:hypothetical protein
MKFSRLASALRERYMQEHTFDLYRQLMECERAEIKGVGVYGNLLLDFPPDSLIDHRRDIVLVCLVIGLSSFFRIETGLLVFSDRFESSAPSNSMAATMDKINAE